MLNEGDKEKQPLAQESAVILKKREKLAEHFQKLEGKITDQSLSRVKINILRTLERSGDQRAPLQKKQVLLSSSLELSGEVKSVISKITEAKKLL